MTMVRFLPAILMAASLAAAYLPAAHAADKTDTKPSTEAAPEGTHRLLIQVNKRDEEFQDHVLSNIVNLQKHYGVDNIEIEVVAYGPGIWLLTEKSAHRKRIESLLLQNVVFTACGNTLDTVAKDGKRPPLIEGVGEVQAGITRIIERQEQGWSYLSP